MITDQFKTRDLKCQTSAAHFHVASENVSGLLQTQPDAFKKGPLAKRINRQRSRRDASNIWMLTVA